MEQCIKQNQTKTRIILLSWSAFYIAHVFGFSILPFEAYSFLPKLGYVIDANMMSITPGYVEYSAAYIELGSMGLVLAALVVMQIFFITVRYLAHIKPEKSSYSPKFALKSIPMVAAFAYILFWPTHSNFFNAWPQLSFLPIPMVILLVNLLWGPIFMVLWWQIIAPDEIEVMLDR